MKEIMKKIAVICIVGMFVSGCSPEEEPNSPVTNNEEDTKVNEVLTYNNVEKIETTLETSYMKDFKYDDIEFAVKINGNQSTYSEDNLSDILKYKFKLKVKEGKYDITLNYNGIMLSDFVEKEKIESYNNIIFKTKNGSNLTVPAKDAEDVLLIFQSEDKDLNEWGPIKVVVTTYNNSTWLENVNYIEFN